MVMTTLCVRNIVVVKYELNKKKVLHYLGVIQQVNEDNVFVQFMKRSGEKTFSIKEGDMDQIYMNYIVMKVSSEVSVNSRGQYILKENLPMALNM